MTRKLLNTIVQGIKTILNIFRLLWIYWLRHKPSKVWVAAFAILLKINKKLAVTRYDHGNRVELDKGSYAVDCSGFVNHVLDQVHPKALQEVQAFSNDLQDYPKPKEASQPWPLHYMLFLQSKEPNTAKRHWKSIENALELKPGDIIAYASSDVSIQKKLSPQMGTIQKDFCSERGQHMMIVSGPIRIEKEVPWIWVPIFDSTKIPHGREDKRGNNGGIGTGVIGLELDAKKAPQRLKWYDTSKYPLKRNIRMGTVIENNGS